ncbi:ATP synthase E chain-domain-containing protein [Rhizophagus diaphanus]|nr:ATP synthase E chain-domain-containing protein [Rhizophagus diaphanus] [Rhizophagus sp. MUCL 43196]
MASTNVKVARWTALALGVTYGLVHRRSLVNAEAKKKATAEYKHREELINEAKLAYSASKKHDDVITDPDDPNFDLEKLINHFEKK